MTTKLTINSIRRHFSVWASIPAIMGFLIVVGTPTFTGCQGPQSQQAIAARTLKSIQTATDAALKVYGTARVTNKVTPQKRQEIQKTRLQYQSAFRLAVHAARGDKSQLAPDDVVKLADALILLITSL